MNVNILKSTALAATMALAACTTQVIESPDNNGNNLGLGQGEDVIRISLTNTTNTRAARPIGSSEATNNVNRIAFKFLTRENDMDVEVEGITLEGVIDNISGEADPAYDKPVNNVLKLPYDYDGSEIYIKFSGLKTGSYKIIAYGYNYTAGSDTEDIFPYDITLKGKDYLLQCEDVTDVQEIFAGCNGSGLAVVNKHNKFSEPPVIQLKRQVAGLMAYFKNAPVYVNNQKVAQITVSSKADVTGFYFPASLLGDPSYNGIATSDWNESKWVHYLTFDMKKASNYNQNHGSDATYQFDNQDEGFLLAEDMEEIEGLTCDEDTLFGSRFLLAYPSSYDCFVAAPKCATLNICYWTETGDLILCVPLRNGGEEKPLDSSKAYQYHILCNNFYAIGTKNALDGDPDNNNPLDIDEPTGYDYAQVSISDNWDGTHDLVN